MRHLLWSVFVLVTIYTATYSQNRLEKYRRLDIYEVRPGIVAVPTYGPTGQICEMGIEKLHYSPKVARLISEISNQEIDEILAELVPADERGPAGNPLNNFGSIQGSTIHSLKDFENISLTTFAMRVSKNKSKTLVFEQRLAVIRWKKRLCE